MSIEFDIAAKSARLGIERTLTSISVEIVGRSDIGIHDSLFDKGLARSDVGQLQRRIKQYFGFDITEQAIYESPTIFGLSLVLRGDPSPGRELTLIQLRSSESPRALVCFHPVGGGAARYAHLARELDGIDVYAVQSVGLNHASEPDRTIEQMAERYFEEIKRAGLESKRLVLMGFSMGGVLAVEVAKRIQAVWGLYPPVVVVDGKPSYSGSKGVDVDFRVFVRQVLLLDLDVEPNPAGDLHDALDNVYGNAVDKGFLPQSFPLELLHRILEVFRTNVEACAGYSGSHFPGEVFLFRCTKNSGALDDLGWADYADGVHRFDLQADHFSALEPQHVNEIAGKLAQLFR